MGLIQYIGRKLSDGANYVARKVSDGYNYLASKAPIIRTFMDRAGGVLQAARAIAASPLVQKYVPAASAISKGLNIADSIVKSQRAPQKNDRAELEARIVSNPEKTIMQGYGEDLD